MKKISIIGTVGIPAKYGGFETLAEYLTKYLSFHYDMTVFCSSKSYDKKNERHNGATLEYINLHANGIQSIPYDILSIFKSLRFADTMLILGVSGCIVLPLVKLFSSKRIVVNIDGLEWKRDKWNKLAKLFLKFSEKIAIKYADIVVVDNKVIQDYVMNEYGKQSELIAYGADHVTKECLGDELKTKYPYLDKPYAFNVCRIEPENNINIILEAFSENKAQNIVVVGNWANSKYGTKMKKKYEEFENIHLLDPIYNQKTLNQIRSNCYIYIHGHSAGGTNPSLVEAMYLGLPIVAYDVAYNRETTRNNAKYFKTASDLNDIIMNTSDVEWSKIGYEMKKIAEKEYVWSDIAKKYANLF